MGLFDWLSGKRHRNSVDMSAGTLFYWQQHPSIYEHVAGHIEPGRPGLTDGGEELPDDERLNARSVLRWVSGALDGVSVRLFHAAGDDVAADTAALLDSVRMYCQKPSREAKQRVHDLVRAKTFVEIVDPFLQSLTKTKELNAKHLYDLAKSMAVESPDREPVKLGVAILGMFRKPSEKALFKTLGRHEEFTLYCAVALKNASESPDDELWELARNVRGWGRIAVVERLASTNKPEIRDWLLREGFRNSIMNEYLAYTCAVAGDLRAALQKDRVDDALLQSSGEIISALLNGGPAQDMNDYGDGAVVVERYLKHLSARARQVKHFLVVNAIRDWVSKDRDWLTSEKRGWSPKRRRAIEAQCQEISGRALWHDLVFADLRSSDEQTFYDADRAAPILGIETWKYHWQRLQNDPQKSGRWFWVMQACNPDRIGDVVALAERSLPLAAIAAGPKSDMAVGAEFEPHRCLDFLLQALGRFPGYGSSLVRAGLRSPVISNRHVALRTLAKWSRGAWPHDIESALRKAITEEPDEKVRQNMEKVIEGKPVD